jgi:anti-sigma factor RsiW
MESCKITDEALWEHLDGVSPTLNDAGLAEHVRACTSCSARVAAAQAAKERLRHVIDGALGEVEPLRALGAIRARISAVEQGSLSARLKAMWQDLWTFNRRAVAGVVMAMGLGALSAPAVVLWSAEGGGFSGRDDRLAAVQIESLEYDGAARAVVYKPDHGTTTLIWLEPDTRGF